MARPRANKNEIVLIEQFSDKLVKRSILTGIGSYLGALQPIVDLG